MPSHNSAPSTNITLPSELVDMVIDFLHSDKESLRRSSTVAKAWLPSTRYHLFQELCIHEGTLERTELHLRAVPKFASYVQKLTVVNVDRIQHILPILLPLFGQAKCLALYGLTWATIQTWQKTCIKSILPQISELEIKNASFDDSRHLEDFITSASHLQSLSMWDFDTAGVHLAEAPYCAPPNSMDTLSIQCGWDGTIPSILRSYFVGTRPTIRILEILQIEPSNAEHASDFQRALRKLGSVLEHLTIGYMHVDDPQRRTYDTIKSRFLSVR